MKQEIWKDIEGYEGLYQVSSLGRVKSLDRYVNCPINGINAKRLAPGKILFLGCRNRYPFITLYKTNISKTFSVHWLVAKAFIPNPENRKEINHLNGSRLDNNVSNLEWCTHSENIRHADKTGLRKMPKGENQCNSKLKQHQVNSLRFEYKNNNITQLELAKKYGVSRQTISDIINFKYWK